MADMDEIADLLFTLFISYAGALEFFYVVRHLYHWSFNHDAATGSSSTTNDSLEHLQDSLRSQLAEATERQQRNGRNAMQDGVLYHDGFRIDPRVETLDQMENDGTSITMKEKRRKEIESELERQKKIEEETKKQLEAAESALAEERKRQQKAFEDNERKLLANEKSKDEENQKREREENERKIFGAERNLEEQQKKLELEQKQVEENVFRNQKAALDEQLENEKKIYEAEKAFEEEQRRLELEHLKQLAEEEEALEFARQLIAQDKIRQHAEEDQLHSGTEEDEDILEKDIVKKMLNTEQMSPDRKQKIIAENARKFLEAEQEMVDLLELGQKSVEEPVIQKVKTQFGQTTADPYSSSSKSLLFPSVSDDGSSVEPDSSQQSSLSNQHSEEVLTTGPEDTFKQFPHAERQEPDGEDNVPDIQYTEEYLRSLDGIKNRPLMREDGSGRRRAFKKRRSSSSNSSKDSRASRDEELKMFTSLEEEEMRNLQKPNSDYIPIKYSSEPNLKIKPHQRRHKRSPVKDDKPHEDSLRASLEMLGEETTNPWGEVVPEHYKNTEFWKREKAMSIDEEEIEISLSSVSPDLKQHDEHREMEDRGQNTQHLKEKNEGNLEDLSRLKHKTSSFEEATPAQSDEATAFLQKQHNDETLQQSSESNSPATQTTSSENENKHLQTSQDTEVISRSSHSSPRLRRSPRIDEHMEEYEDQHKTKKSPIISIHQPVDDGPWRDDHGLLMQGLSDFYDFTASINSSRSRSTSRNPSPSPTKPQNISYSQSETKFEAKDFIQEMDENYLKSLESSKQGLLTASSPLISMPGSTNDGPWRDARGILVEGLSDFYDFAVTINLSKSRSASRSSSPASSEAKSASNEKTNLALDKHHDYLDSSKKFDMKYDVYDDTQSFEQMPSKIKEIVELLTPESNEVSKKMNCLKTVADKPENTLSSCNEIPVVLINDENYNRSDTHTQTMFQSLRLESSSSGSYSETQRRSRSPSPLPTDNNIEKSLQTRREKRIKHNDDIFDRLQSSSPSPTEENDLTEPIKSYLDSKDEMSNLIATLRAERVRSHSRSKSPLPSAVNVEKSLEHRRKKRTQQNDDLFEKLESQTTPDEEDSKENLSFLMESLRLERGRARSPLPTARNLEQSLEARRNKRIQQNNEISEQIETHNQNKSQAEENSREEMKSLIEFLRAERVRSHSRSKTPLPPSSYYEKSLQTNIESECHNKGNTENDMSTFISTLKTERGRSRSRSRSPFPSARSFEPERNPRFQERRSVENQSKEKLLNSSGVTPKIYLENVGCLERKSSEISPESNMNSLIANLPLQGSESRSKSPMRSPTPDNVQSTLNSRLKKLEERTDLLIEELEEKAKTSEHQRLIFEYIYDFEKDDETASAKIGVRERHSQSGNTSRSPSPNSSFADQPRDRQSRSQTPSRSPSPTLLKETFGTDSKASSFSNLSALDNLSDYLDFHMMLNLEDSLNKTLSKQTEEFESCLASAQFQIDAEALEKLRTANEEIELRTTTPYQGESEEERLRQLKCSSTRPDYDRTISEEWLDSQRMKNDFIKRGFKRSTYVGESIDFGTEYASLRREAAVFRRSRTPSPSIHITDIDLETSRRNAAEQREVQSNILSYLAEASSPVQSEEGNKHGAKPKIDKKCSYQTSEELNADLESLRRLTADFRRSRSKSRSPPEIKETAQKAFLDELEVNTKHFKEFSRHLNADFLESERRASDSALIQKPEILIQFQDTENLPDMEPEEYHHYRRFSLAQEQPVEEYPSDDFIYVSQVEVHTPSGTRTWLREDYYSQHLETLNLQLAEVLDAEEAARENEEAWLRNEDDSNGSEDERQTVVEVEDEIEEDLADYNERGPTDESHHEISECEEADREQDRYAGRGAQDWENVDSVNNFFDYGFENPPSDEGGAVGGNSSGAYDSDSFAIDQMYEEAIKNRKHSGILRDYDCILQEMSNNIGERAANFSSADSDSDREKYALWAKTRALEKANHIELARSFLEQERKENEMRYLGDAEATTRQAVRLRSRYGYAPVIPSNNNLDNLAVDLSYRPKREYNWRKNFKIDEEEPLPSKAKNGTPDSDHSKEIEGTPSDPVPDETQETIEWRKFSLGGESITLFSQSPEKEQLHQVPEEDPNLKQDSEIAVEEVSAAVPAMKDKVKKKKSKKKTRKEMKAQEDLLAKEDEDSESQLYNRRSSSIQMDTDSPRRSSRSRRSSKASTEDSSLLFSPRSSVGIPEPIWDTTKSIEPSLVVKKKTKKRKKTKTESAECKVQSELILEEIPHIQISDALAVSCTVTPNSSNGYLLASVSPQNNKCLTPPSEESDNTSSKEKISRDDSIKSFDSTISRSSIPSKEVSSSIQSSTLDAQTSTSFSAKDAFDFLKDSNFYPLF